MLDLLDFDNHLVRTSFQHAVFIAAHRMAQIYRTTEGGSPKAGGLVQVCGLAIDEHGAQAGMVHANFPPLKATGESPPFVVGVRPHNRHTYCRPTFGLRQQMHEWFALYHYDSRKRDWN